MSWARFGRRLLWPAAAMAVVLAAAAQQPPESAPATEPVKILFPADKAVLESGKFDVVCAMRAAEGKSPPPPRLLVDGSPRNWDPYKQPTLLSRVQLPPGSHEIGIGDTTLHIYIRDEAKPEEAPDGWPTFRSHRGATEGWKTCTTCHEVTKEQGLNVRGALLEPAACNGCHPPADFELTHFHPADPLAACHTCHALHGSANKSLLKGPVKQLCAGCHD